MSQAVLSKIRDRFGGNLKVSLVGGAATSMEVLNFFENIDIKILEGYGLTETSPMVTVNTTEQVRSYDGNPLGGLFLLAGWMLLLLELPVGLLVCCCCGGRFSSFPPTCRWVRVCCKLATLPDEPRRE